MALVDVAGEAGDDTAGITTPVRCEQAGECGHEVDPPVVVNGPRERFDLGRAADQAHLVAEPLDERPGDGDRAFERVGRGLVPDLRTHRRDQSMSRQHRPAPGVEEEEAPRPVGALRLARRKARLTEERRLLIAERRGDGNAAERVVGLAVNLRRGLDHRQHGTRDSDRIEQRVVPVERLEIHQHGSTGVGDVGDVTPGEVPDEPAVHRPEEKVALLGSPAQSRSAVQQPAHLRSGEIGCEGQSAPVAEPVLAVLTAELPAEGVRARVLPHNGVLHGLAGMRIPDDRRLTLVCDADRDEVAHIEAAAIEGAVHHFDDVAQDLARIMLDPTRSRKYLLVFLLAERHDAALLIKDEASRGGCALVDGGNESIAQRTLLHADCRAAGEQLICLCIAL